MEGYYIWIMDLGCNGCIIVVAKTEDEARNLMEGELNYNPLKKVTRFDITPNFSYCNLGDL